MDDVMNDNETVSVDEVMDDEMDDNETVSVDERMDDMKYKRTMRLFLWMK